MVVAWQGALGSAAALFTLPDFTGRPGGVLRVWRYGSDRGLLIAHPFSQLLTHPVHPINNPITGVFAGRL